MTHQHQIVAIVKSRKDRLKKLLTEAYQRAQKPDLFNGIVRKYKPMADDVVAKPPERKEVETTVRELIENIKDSFIETYDTVLTQDEGNKLAVADVNALEGAASFLFRIFRLRICSSLRSSWWTWLLLSILFLFLTVLSSWQKDGSNQDISKTEPVVTHSTAKVQRPLVLYPATPEHPAQTQLITEDTVVGSWETIKTSGAISLNDKKKILRRATALYEAVKKARESANSVQITDRKEASKIFDFVFGA